MLKRIGAWNACSAESPPVLRRKAAVFPLNRPPRPVIAGVPGGAVPTSLHFAPPADVADIVMNVPGVSNAWQRTHFSGDDDDESSYRFTTANPTGIVRVRGNRYADHPAFMRMMSYLQLPFAPDSIIEFMGYKEDPSRIVSSVVTSVRGATAGRKGAYILMAQDRAGKYIALDIADALLYSVKKTPQVACEEMTALMRRFS